MRMTFRVLRNMRLCRLVCANLRVVNFTGLISGGQFFSPAFVLLGNLKKVK